MMKRINGYLILLALCVLLAACGKKNETETAAETAEETTLPEGITYPGAIRVTVPETGAVEIFGVMHGVILDVQSDENGNPVLTVRDDEDPENAWTVDTAFVKDVALEAEKGGRAALFFHGDIENDPDAVEMIAVWPDGKYTLKVMDGVTADSTVDDFEVRESGRENAPGVRLLKNNCLADKDTTGTVPGTGVRAVYVDGAASAKYPLRIYRNTESE